LVRGGSEARFSPDGNFLAYTVSTASFLGESKIYLLPVNGGVPRQLAADVPWAMSPVFSPDGSHILFAGAPSSNATGEIDWWIAPVNGGPSVKTGIRPALRKQGLAVGFFQDWIEDRVLFGDRKHIWEVKLSPQTWQAAGPARQITSGAGPFSEVRAVRIGGRTVLVLAVPSGTAHLFSLLLDPKTGKAIGELKPLFFAGGDQSAVTGSADGRKIVYMQTEAERDSIRLRDLITGGETTLISARVRPQMSPDGSMVAYSDGKQLSMIPASGGEASQLLDFKGMGAAFGWSPDSRRIVYWDSSPIRFSWFDVQSRQTAELISHPKYDIHGASLSPDQRWLLFFTPLQRKTIVRITPMRDGRAAGEAEWITVLDREANNRVPFWSRDGNLVYFLTNLDGSQCFYGQRLDPATKRPVGDPFPLYHFHQSRLRLPPGANMGGVILPDRLIIASQEISSNIWIAESRE
jgi:Tol biopolymer transport system component